MPASTLSLPRLENGRAFVPVAVDIDAFHRLANALGAGDVHALVDLALDGQVLTVAGSTPAEPVDDALTAVRVRVAAGEWSGRDGWIPSAWLQAA